MPRMKKKYPLVPIEQKKMLPAVVKPKTVASSNASYVKALPNKSSPKFSKLKAAGLIGAVGAGSIIADKISKKMKEKKASVANPNMPEMGPKNKKTKVDDFIEKTKKY